MKYLSLVLVLCGVASLAMAPARAFDIQGENASLQDGSTPFISPPNQFINSDYSKGSSLALPYIGSADSNYISDYGNSIPIPGPGIDRPSPGLGLLAPLLNRARQDRPTLQPPAHNRACWCPACLRHDVAMLGREGN